MKRDLTSLVDICPLGHLECWFFVEGVDAFGFAGPPAQGLLDLLVADCDVADREASPEVRPRVDLDGCEEGAEVPDPRVDGAGLRAQVVVYLLVSQGDEGLYVLVADRGFGDARQDPYVLGAAVRRLYVTPPSAEL